MRKATCQPGYLLWSLHQQEINFYCVKILRFWGTVKTASITLISISFICCLQDLLLSYSSCKSNSPYEFILVEIFTTSHQANNDDEIIVQGPPHLISQNDITLVDSLQSWVTVSSSRSDTASLLRMTTIFESFTLHQIIRPVY